MGSFTETVTFQVYEILKIDHEFLQFWSETSIASLASKMVSFASQIRVATEDL